jgi:TM2 domain-containing membrane protein YozV
MENKIISETSKKAKLATLLFWFFLGGVSAHRFYTGKIGTAFLQMFTIGGLGFWLLVDGIMIVTNNFKDKEGKKITVW